MRTIVIGCLTCVAIVFALWYFFHPPHATLVLINGVIHAVDDSMHTFDAVAIEGDRIAGAGTTKEILHRFTADSVIDLEGKAVYPGFTDAHAHLEGLGISMMTLDLTADTTVAGIRERVLREAQRTGGQLWIRGRGWDQNRWPGRQFPTSDDLETGGVTAPVFLVRIDGHAAWVNKRVLALAGITATTPDPAGGKILRDHNGSPTGVLVDNAIDLVRRIIPRPSRGERMHAVRLAVAECLRVGLTGVHDMGVDAELIGIYQELEREGRLPFRIYAAVDGPGAFMDTMLVRGPAIGDASARLTVRAVKLYADGALGSRGAALIEPYTDDPGNRGITMQSSEVLRQFVRSAVKAGFQVCTHAIGDRANAQVLDAYETAIREAGPGQDLRLRIEHAQVLAPSDVARFAHLGVIPSMQPTHCTSDMSWAADRLGPVRVQSAYAGRSLLDAGSIIPAGSDFPVERPSPLLGFASAISRQDAEGFPEGGWNPVECMTREEALKAFTRWAAFASFREETYGSIEEGKVADLTILDRDIMTAPAGSIRGIPVSMTMVGGEIVYPGLKTPAIHP
jgi:predicted amidohydrolase YtcJ